VDQGIIIHHQRQRGERRSQPGQGWPGFVIALDTDAIAAERRGHHLRHGQHGGWGKIDGK